MVSRGQLLEFGVRPRSIEHRAKTGRLHRVRRGVYAVGRPELTRKGHWIAAVLSCGRGAVLSHESAAALWGIEDRERRIIVSLPSSRRSRQRDIRVHCLKFEPGDRGLIDSIPVTSPVRTLIDLATLADPRRLEAALNAADKLGLVHPNTLRSQIVVRRRQAGVPALLKMLDPLTFRRTDSDLERTFLRLVRQTNLPLPETGVRLHGFRLDFFWRDLGLVVETDGLRYHRTPSQQAKDRLRDQTLTTHGLTVLRFAESQVGSKPNEVKATLLGVAHRLATAARAA